MCRLGAVCNNLAFHRCNIPVGVTIYVCWNCVVLLVAVEATIDDCWRESMQYVHTLPLPGRHNLYTLWGDEKANRFLVDVKDIYEAITGFCMPNTMDRRSLRTSLERKRAGE